MARPQPYRRFTNRPQRRPAPTAETTLQTAGRYGLIAVASGLGLALERVLWRLRRNGKRSSMRCPPGTRIRAATKFGLQVLRPFIAMSLAFRSGLMATAMGSAASPIVDDRGCFELSQSP